jgi:D-beta-D-heptose 7-phosphate kinase/D-beta-D-heptose 1-phosphate adenosyltransferase
VHPIGNGRQVRTLTPELPPRLQAVSPRITVIGDVMLDGWWFGPIERMCREAPAPVVELGRRHYAPGGAANTAMNLAALGAKVRLVGVIGQDQAGMTLRRLLESADVDVSGLLSSPDSTTVTKTRVVSGDQILLRLDDLQRSDSPTTLQADVAGAAAAALTGSDALIVCDYDSGTLLRPVSEALTAANRPPLVVVDAHDCAPWSAIQPDLVTPNATEAFRLLGRGLPSNVARLPALETAGPALLACTGARAVVVTLDREGTLLLTGDGVVHRTHTRPVTEKQAAGAGDTFVAALTLARSAGLSLPVSAELAQAAADVVVQRFGTTVCSTEELVEHLGGPTEAVLSEDVLLLRVQADRAAGRTIVFTNGCFDVLHRGHTSYLAQAARLGDVLVVAVNSDRSVRELKGHDRPINSDVDRAAVVASLKCVSYVTVFDTDTPIPLLERLQPDIYAKGGDYTPEMLAETAVVQSYGGEVRILDYVPAQSTTGVVSRIRGASRSQTAVENR